MSKYLIILILLTPKLFFGWGKEGHKIVAEIAKQKLNTGITEKVQKYLGNMTFEEAATWMDDIKKDKENDFMKPWHYVNIAHGKNYQKDSTNNIVYELQTVISKLKNYKSLKDDEVNLNLKILFHLCGDIAQPLHVGYATDKGGNDIKVEYNGKQSNLHKVWDTEIIISEKIIFESCIQISNALSKRQQKKYSKTDVLYWMKDARKLLDNTYKFSNKIIDPSYILYNKLVVEKQLIKGGLRLAAVLNSIFEN